MKPRSTKICPMTRRAIDTCQLLVVSCQLFAASLATCSAYSSRSVVMTVLTAEREDDTHHLFDRDFTPSLRSFIFFLILAIRAVAACVRCRLRRRTCRASALAIRLPSSSGLLALTSTSSLLTFLVRSRA